MTFTLRWSARRRTIGITVRHDGALVVAAPVGCPPRRVREVVRDKLPWVRRQLAKVVARPTVPRRLWTDGERLPYLGAGYPLRLVEDGAVPVRLRRGAFLMTPVAAADGRRHMVQWYTDHAGPLLTRRVAHFRDAVAASPESIRVGDLGRRWGTCDARGRVRFHWQVVLFPRPVIDYIVVHELAHVHELNHSRRFWERVEHVLPDCARRKAWLREHAAGHTL